MTYCCWQTSLYNASQVGNAQNMLLRLILLHLLHDFEQLITNCHVNFADDSDIQKFVLQLLVNMTASSPVCLELLWAQFFPGRLSALASASQGRLSVQQKTTQHRKTVTLLYKASARLHKTFPTSAG